MIVFVGVCGDRNYSNSLRVKEVMDALRMKIKGEMVIVHGGATGADMRAKMWALTNWLHHIPVEALWEALGTGAGPRRNAVIAALPLKYLVAFPGGKGTADMVKKARKAGIKVIEVKP